MLWEQLGLLQIRAEGRRDREGNVRRPFQTRAAGERVGMALDKLPDPLPLRHWEQWGGRAICRQWYAHIRLHPFLSDEVEPRSSGQPQAGARRRVGACVRS